MRLIPIAAAAFVLCLSGPSFAQEWNRYVSRTDFFTVNFPAQPTVRDITYPTEYGITLPGRVHIHEDGHSRYSVTVVDYSNVQKIHAERLTNCQKYPNLCNNPWVGELRGAMDYAAYKFLQRDAKLMHFAVRTIPTGWKDAEYSWPTRIARRRSPPSTCTRIDCTFLEGTVPADAPPPGLFQQSLGFIDKQGIRVRYESVYSNMYPPPPRIQYQVPQGQN